MQGIAYTKNEQGETSKGMLACLVCLSSAQEGFRKKAPNRLGSTVPFPHHAEMICEARNGMSHAPALYRYHQGTPQPPALPAGSSGSTGPLRPRTGSAW